MYNISYNPMYVSFLDADSADVKGVSRYPYAVKLTTYTDPVRLAKPDLS